MVVRGTLRHGPLAARHRGAVRKRRAAGRHDPQLRRCGDRDPARDRVRVREAHAKPPLLVRLRADRGPRWRGHRPDDLRERGAGRTRGGDAAAPPLARRPSRSSGRRRHSRLRGQRVGGMVSDPGRPRDRQRRAARRRLPRTAGRVHQSRSPRRRGGGLGGLPPGGSHRGPPDHRRHRRPRLAGGPGRAHANAGWSGAGRGGPGCARGASRLGRGGRGRDSRGPGIGSSSR